MPLGERPTMARLGSEGYEDAVCLLTQRRTVRGWPTT